MDCVSTQSVLLVILLRVAVTTRSALFAQFHENKFYTRQTMKMMSAVFNYFLIQASVSTLSRVATIKRSNFGEMENLSKVWNTQTIVTVSILTKQTVFWLWLLKIMTMKLRVALLSGESKIFPKSENKKSAGQWTLDSTPIRPKLLLSKSTAKSTK